MLFPFLPFLSKEMFSKKEKVLCHEPCPNACPLPCLLMFYFMSCFQFILTILLLSGCPACPTAPNASLAEECVLNGDDDRRDGRRRLRWRMIWSF